MSKKASKVPVKPKPERVNPFLIKKNVPPAKEKAKEEDNNKPVEIVGKLRPLTKAELIKILAKLPTKCHKKETVKELEVISESSEADDKYDCDADEESLSDEELPGPSKTSQRKVPAISSKPQAIVATQPTEPTTAVIPDADPEQSNENELIKLVASPLKETDASLAAIKKLIDSGVNLNHKVDNGTTPLILAVKRQHLRTAQLLIDSGANINLQDDDGRSPLNWAVHRETAEMVHLLLSNKADPLLRNKKDETCFYTALNERSKKMQELLSFSQVCCWRPGLPLSFLKGTDYKKNKLFSFVKDEINKNLKESDMSESELPNILRDSETHTPSMQAALLDGLAWDAQVITALDTLNLSNYGRKFAKNRITFDKFLKLGDRDLAQIGICSVSAIKKILDFTASYTEFQDKKSSEEPKRFIAS